MAAVVAELIASREARAAISIVAHTTIPPGVYSGQTSAAVDTTGATLLFMVLPAYPVQVFPIDSYNNVWLPQITLGGGNPIICNYYCQNPNVGPGHTFGTCSTSSVPTYSRGFVAAFSGVSALAPFDQSTSNTANNTTTIQPGALTPSQNGALILTGISVNVGGGSATTVSINSGFTITDQEAFPASGGMGGALAYLVQGSAASVNPTWSNLPNPSFNLNIATSAVFLPAPWQGTKQVIFTAAYNGDLSLNAAANATNEMNVLYGTDLTHHSSNTCSGTALATNTIVLNAADATTASIGHAIQWKTGNTCVIESITGDTATVYNPVNSSYNANFGGLPLIGDAYTIFPLAPTLIIGPPSAGHTIYYGTYGAATDTGFITSNTTSNVNTILTIEGSASVHSGQAGTFTDGTGFICVANNGDHEAVFYFSHDNIIVKNIGVWNQGGAGPTAQGEGCFQGTGYLNNFSAYNFIFRGDNWSYDNVHLPRGDTIFNANLFNGVMVQSSWHLQGNGLALKQAVNCTLLNAQNITLPATQTISSGSTITVGSTAALEAESGGNWGPGVGHPALASGTQIASIVDSTHFTITGTISGTITSGDNLYIGAWREDLPIGNSLGQSALPSNYRNCALFGFSHHGDANYSFGGSWTATNCATDYTAGVSGLTAMSYAAQFNAGYNAGAGPTAIVDARPAPGNSLAVGVGATGTDIYGNAFTSTTAGAISLAAAAATASGLIGGGINSGTVIGP